ncbi:hypothetical protein T492DRAFT_1066524, partial [Pavlovales sp. CCMP2436]
MFDSALWVVLPGDPESCPKSPRSTASRTSRAALNLGSDPFARYTSPWTTGPTHPRAPGSCATRRGTWNRSDAAPRLLPPSSSTLEPPAFVKGTREEPRRAPSIVAATLEPPPAVRTSPPPCEPLALADVGEFLHAHFVAVSHSGSSAVNFARSKADIEMAAEVQRLRTSLGAVRLRSIMTPPGYQGYEDDAAPCGRHGRAAAAGARPRRGVGAGAHTLTPFGVSAGA